MGTLNVKTDSKEYEIIIKRGILEEAGKYIPSHNKILIVTDENIPSEYTNAVRECSPLLRSYNSTCRRTKQKP